MDILASDKWLKEYVKTDASAVDIAREVSLRSMSVESVDDVGARFAQMVVGEVKAIESHPGADRLRVVKTDIGGEVVDIVCGGSNVVQGMKVLVALPGAKVRWHGQEQWTRLEPTTIRGVASAGMICAPAEVGFDKLACGEKEIWDLTNLTSAKAGTPIAQALDLDECVFLIEVTTNRPDVMSIIGLARETGASLGVDFAEFRGADNFPLPEGEQKGVFAVTIAYKKGCPRYMAAVIDGLKIGPSPWWLQKKLLLAGHRPINTIVDITNLVLHEYGQPLHAFDAEKLSGKQIIVRKAKKGEKLVALDGKEYKLSAKNIVIADQDKPLAVAGVMGSIDSSTTEATTSIVFEAATFDPVSVRRTARELNLYSDAQLLYEKGLSPEALPAALARAIELAEQLAGGKLAQLIDVRSAKPIIKTVTLRPKVVRSRIGVDIKDEEMEVMLKRLGFTIEKKGGRSTVTVPYWRHGDITGDADLTEEIARLYGYHKLPAVLPMGSPPATDHDAILVWESWLKHRLQEAGYTEFFSSSLIDAHDLERYGFAPAEAVAVLNPLSEDLRYLRPSLMPGLLRAIERNQAQTGSGQVFELSRAYAARKNELPDERLSCVIAQFGVDDAEATFMKLRGAIEIVLQSAGAKLRLERLVDEEKWHPVRAAELFVDDVPVGVLGEVARAFRDAFGIQRPVFVAELNIEQLIPHLTRGHRYTKVAEFPLVCRDISVLLNERTPYEDVVKAAKESSSLVRAVDLQEIYRGQGVETGKKSLTLSIELGADDRTLTSEEADGALAKIVSAIGSLGGVLRS